MYLLDPQLLAVSFTFKSALLGAFECYKIGSEENLHLVELYYSISQPHSKGCGIIEAKILPHLSLRNDLSKLQLYLIAYSCKSTFQTFKILTSEIETSRLHFSTSENAIHVQNAISDLEVSFSNLEVDFLNLQVRKLNLQVAKVNL